MLELTERNAAEILHAHGHLADPRTAKVRELSGGVSNAVFLIEQGTERFVVKQALGKLRVQADWQCSVERIWREVEVLTAMQGLLHDFPLTPHPVPQILWQDQELYSYAMTAAAEGSQTWKEQLFSRHIDFFQAYVAGSLLGRFHARSWLQADLAEKLADRTFFVQLRLEPYYLWTAAKYPRLKNALHNLVAQSEELRLALVHGDFSPKNLLAWNREMMLIDFEVGHYGDPAFDLGFCLTHFVLKSIHFSDPRFLAMADSLRTHWFIQIRNVDTGTVVQALEHRALQHLAGCLVARVHGKSPVDYLTPPEQLRVVALAEKLFELGPAASWSDAKALLELA